MRKQKTIEYFLILWIVASYLIPSVGDLVGMEWISSWIYKLSMNMLIGYLGYFILGYYIRKYNISDRIRMCIYFGGFIGLLYTIMRTISESRMQEAYVETFLNPSSWNVLLWSTAMFTFFAYRKEVKWCPKLVDSVARCSFIIYMIHPFFLEKLNMIGVTTMSFNCVISIPVLTIAIFVASYVVAAIIKKIPCTRKFVL